MAKAQKKTKKVSIFRKLKSNASGVDLPFLIYVFCFLAIGLVMICSASYVSAYYKEGDSFFYVKKQLIWTGLGLIAMYVVSRIDYRLWRKFIWVILLVALAMVILVLIPGIGIERDDARRWLGFGGLTFQPSEIAKLAIIMYLANYITINYHKMKSFKEGFAPAFGVLILFTFLVAIETHISGAILIISIGIVMLFVGGTSLKLMGGLAALGAGGITSLILFTDYAKRRIMSWWDPFAYAQEGGYQIIQALYAIGSGGLLGLGLGQSRQKHMYIPEPQNDYIFAIICEELGFVGAVALLLLYALLIWRGFKIAFSMKDRFGMLLVVGITSRVAIQALLNIAVVTKILPSTGIGLPFISYGGTALLVLMVEMGLVLSVSRHSELDREIAEESGK